jgi:hypothetical protein
VNERIREKVREEPDECGLCGHAGLVIERSRYRRRGFARLNPVWDPAERTYRVCPACQARHRLIDGQPI